MKNKSLVFVVLIALFILVRPATAENAPSYPPMPAFIDQDLQEVGITYNQYMSRNIDNFTGYSLSHYIKEKAGSADYDEKIIGDFEEETKNGTWHASLSYDEINNIEAGMPSFIISKATGHAEADSGDEVAFPSPKDTPAAYFKTFPEGLNTYIFQYREMYFMNPDNDTLFDANEFKDMLKYYFSRADIDGNKTLSAQEVAKAREMDSAFLWLQAKCPLYITSPKTNLVSVSLGRYGSISDREKKELPRHHSTVHIAEDMEPFYLSLNSYEPIDWTFTGNTDSIIKVVFTENYKYFSGDTEISGISQDKIERDLSNCMKPYSDKDKNIINKAQTANQIRFGQKADMISGSYAYHDIDISNSGITIREE
ncbi:MAG: hypothetical protein ACQEQL_01565 [Pseudomonadota bacterium]